MFEGSSGIYWKIFFIFFLKTSQDFVRKREQFHLLKTLAKLMPNARISQQNTPTKNKLVKCNSKQHMSNYFLSISDEENEDL